MMTLNEKITKIGRIFYGFAMAALGFQQFFYADFHPMILAPKHQWIPFLSFWAYFAGAALMATGGAIIFEKKARTISLVLGAILFALFIYYIPYEIIVDPYYRYLGSWGDAEKELALSGGAFVMAGSFPEPIKNIQKKSIAIGILEKFIPFGSLFFSITMVSFGIDHFLYTKNVALLVPSWIPAPVFWTYFAAVALIGSGAAIILKVKLRVIAALLGTMILLWFILLHIPRAIAQPFTQKGEEVASAFSALAFSGIAFVIAGSDTGKKPSII
jgi:uncharacterized membrane protein YphA (DoxX/SURF4 family)